MLMAGLKPHCGSFDSFGALEMQEYQKGLCKAVQNYVAKCGYPLRPLRRKMRLPHLDQGVYRFINKPFLGLLDAALRVPGPQRH